MSTIIQLNTFNMIISKKCSRVNPTLNRIKMWTKENPNVSTASASTRAFSRTNDSKSHFEFRLRAQSRSSVNLVSSVVGLKVAASLRMIWRWWTRGCAIERDDEGFWRMNPSVRFWVLKASLLVNGLMKTEEGWLLEFGESDWWWCDDGGGGSGF